MTKKEIQILAKESYRNGVLDEKKAEQFVSYMDRKTLKRFVSALKTLEKKKNVIIALPSLKSYNTNKEMFEKMYTDKTIILEEDPSLMLGVRLTDNDMIYEKSIKTTLDGMTTDVKKNYE